MMLKAKFFCTGVVNIRKIVGCERHLGRLPVIGSQRCCEDNHACRFMGLKDCTKQDRLVHSSSYNLEFFQLLGDLVPVYVDNQIRKQKSRLCSMYRIFRIAFQRRVALAHNSRLSIA